MINFKTNYFGKTVVVFSALVLMLVSFLPMSTASATTSDASDITPYIIGGHAASEPYPGMASLQVDILGDPDFHLCGATLVSRRFVVTNAHCVTDGNGDALDPDLFHLRIGSHNRLEGGVNVGVTRILPHANWDWATGDDPVADIALLRLDDYVQLQPFEVAPKLGDRDAITRLLGWGSTEPSGEGPAPLNLQELDTKLTQPQECATGLITAGEICTHNPNGTDGPCFGDSGGPALQKVASNRWSVVGGTSRLGSGDACGTGTSIYTDHTYYRAWMYEVMRTGVVPPATTGNQPIDTSARDRYDWGLPAQITPRT